MPIQYFLYVCHSFCLSVHVFVRLPVHLSLCPSVCLSICLYICVSVHMSVTHSVCPSISVCLSLCWSVCHSVYPPPRLPRSRCESPLMTSLPRLQTPSPRPRLRSSPATFARSPISLSHADASFAPEPAIESLIPEVCIDHLWTEAASIPRWEAAREV